MNFKLFVEMPYGSWLIRNDGTTFQFKCPSNNHPNDELINTANATFDYKAELFNYKQDKQNMDHRCTTEQFLKLSKKFGLNLYGHETSVLYFNYLLVFKGGLIPSEQYVGQLAYYCAEDKNIFILDFNKNKEVIARAPKSYHEEFLCILLKEALLEDNYECRILGFETASEQRATLKTLKEEINEPLPT